MFASRISNKEKKDSYIFQIGKQVSNLNVRMWNNKEIRINNKPIFYRTFFENGITFVNDLLFVTYTTNSFKFISSKISNTNFLTWAGLCDSVPLHLKTKESTPSVISLLVTIEGKDFNVLKKKSKDYYT